MEKRAEYPFFIVLLCLAYVYSVFVVLDMLPPILFSEIVHIVIFFYGTLIILIFLILIFNGIDLTTLKVKLDAERGENEKPVLRNGFFIFILGYHILMIMIFYGIYSNEIFIFSLIETTSPLISALYSMPTAIAIILGFYSLFVIFFQFQSFKIEEEDAWIEEMLEEIKEEEGNLEES